MTRRAILVTVLLIAGAAAIDLAATPEPVTISGRLNELPFRLRGWTGTTAAPFEEEVIRVLGVDEYIHRVYYETSSMRPAWLYVGFHSSQAEGDSIHSPLNCLPGAGWEPVDRKRVTLKVTDSTGPRIITVNELVIEKGAQRQVVVYWYQSHGRVEASEYRSKLSTVFNAVRYGRSDASFVRIVVPIGTDPAESSRRAHRMAVDMFPKISGVLPL
jgi:EpsI family protein